MIEKDYIQIYDFLRRVPYIPTESLPKEDRNCLICQEPYDNSRPLQRLFSSKNDHYPVRLPCTRHHIGLRCLIEWTLSEHFNNQCPLDRRLMMLRSTALLAPYQKSTANGFWAMLTRMNRDQIRAHKAELFQFVTSIASRTGESWQQKDRDVLILERFFKLFAGVEENQCGEAIVVKILRGALRKISDYTGKEAIFFGILSYVILFPSSICYFGGPYNSDDRFYFLLRALEVLSPIWSILAMLITAFCTRKRLALALSVLFILVEVSLNFSADTDLTLRIAIVSAALMFHFDRASPPEASPMARMIGGSGVALVLIGVHLGFARVIGICTYGLWDMWHYKTIPGIPRRCQALTGALLNECRAKFKAAYHPSGVFNMEAWAAWVDFAFANL